MPFMIDAICERCQKSFKADKYAKPPETVCADCRSQAITYYTITKDEHQAYPFQTLILTPSNRTDKPTVMGFFDSQEEAERETKAQYGQDIVYVGVHRFQALAHFRKGA